MTLTAQARAFDIINRHRARIDGAVPMELIDDIEKLIAANDEARARVAELEALLNAEQAAAEAAGDDIQAALPGYPPPAGHGLGRWRAGAG